MANSSLDGFLDSKEKKVSDLDWLDIDPNDYVNMPFDDTPEYISVPKLEEAYDYTDERKFNLVPNVEHDFNYREPEMKQFDRDKKDDVKKLFNLVKREMMAGKTGDNLVKTIAEKTHPEVIKAAKDQLAKLASEQGLLGKVYVDPTVFKNCDEGSVFVGKRAKTAKYVLAMDKCGGCVFNKQGRCDLYKKHLASEIVYDENLLNFYSNHLSNITGKDIKVASKSDLQNAFIEKKENKTKVAEFKPKVTVGKDEMTLEQKKEQYDKQFQGLQDELSKISNHKIASDLQLMLIKKHSARTMKEYITQKYSKEVITKNASAINDVLSRQGTLGRVYVDASLLPINIQSEKESKEFFGKYAKDVKYVVASCGGCAQCVCKTYNKVVVSDVGEIPQEAFEQELNKYGEEIVSKVAGILQSDPEKAIRLAYLQEDIQKRDFSEPKKADTYGIKRELDANDYEYGEAKKASFTADKVSFALDKGYPISKIIKTGTLLGFDSEHITAEIKKAFADKVTYINKYQLDTDFEIPSNVEIKISAKDTAFDMEKPLEKFAEIDFNSETAPIDTLTQEMGLKEADLDTSGTDYKPEDIVISELDEFNIE